MTEPSKECLNVGSVVFVTTKDSPLRSKLDDLENAFKKWRGVNAPEPVAKVLLEKVFRDQNIDNEKEAFNVMVETLLTHQLAIIDLHIGEAAHYALGVRHALSNGPTIGLSKGEPKQPICQSRFTALPRSYIDVGEDDQDAWLEEVREYCRPLEQARLRAWENDVQGTELFTVRANERPFGKGGCDEVKWFPTCLETDEPLRGPPIAIYKGDITKAKDFSIWVNSENIQMEMARFWDKSISARIRQLGAVRVGSAREDKRKDVLGLALADRMGTTTSVDIGTVIITPTDPGSKINEFNNVTHVAHVAAVIPNERRYGFDSGGKIAHCLRNILKEVKSVPSPRRRNGTVVRKSILIPLLGSGDGGAHPSLVAHQIVGNLEQLLRSPVERKQLGLDEIDTIGLLAYMPSHFEFLTRELRNYGFVGRPDRDKDHASVPG